MPSLRFDLVYFLPPFRPELDREPDLELEPLDLLPDPLLRDEPLFALGADPRLLEPLALALGCVPLLREPLVRAFGVVPLLLDPLAFGVVPLLREPLVLEPALGLVLRGR